MGEKAKKIKIVPDTNIYISALGWNGKERALINKGIGGDFNLFASKEILEEIRKVLNYSKFDFSAEEKTAFLNIIAENFVIIQPRKTLNLIKEDPADNKFLECAVEARADFIISGDKHLLTLKEFNGIKILNASDFLKNI